jgi:accessory gene regulator protein AgrB
LGDLLIPTFTRVFQIEISFAFLPIACTRTHGARLEGSVQGATVQIRLGVVGDYIESLIAANLFLV